MNALKNIPFDKIIIGSGPGAASVTHELSRFGKRILILEKGSGDKIKGTPLQGASLEMISWQGLMGVLTATDERQERPMSGIQGKSITRL